MKNSKRSLSRPHEAYPQRRMEHKSLPIKPLMDAGWLTKTADRGGNRVMDLISLADGETEAGGWGWIGEGLLLPSTGRWESWKPPP